MSDPIKPIQNAPKEPQVPNSPQDASQEDSRFNALSAIQTDSQLRQAFENFSQNSMRLEGAYNTLEAQFRQVSAQLHEVYCQLEVKIKELDAARRYLDNLLGQMAQGVLFVTAGGVVLTCNKAMGGWLEVGGELRGKLFSECFPDQHFGFSMQDALQSGKGPELCYTLQNEEKKNPLLEITTNFITYFSDQPTEGQEEELQEGLLVMARDISELRRLQIAAAHDDRLRDLGQVAETFAEEIRAPLNGIESTATALADSPESGDSSQQILAHCMSIKELLERVVAYAKPQEAQITSLDLAEVLTEVETLMRAQSLFTPKQTFQCQHFEAMTALADRELLKASLLNILINAAHAIGEEGHVTLNLKKDAHFAQIEVIDDGVGIPQEHLAKIFSPFFTTKKSSGGLGLSEVHKRLIAMNAQIDVKSQVKVGSTFSIQVPLPN